MDLLLFIAESIIRRNEVRKNPSGDNQVLIHNISNVSDETDDYKNWKIRIGESVFVRRYTRYAIINDVAVLLFREMYVI